MDKFKKKLIFLMFVTLFAFLVGISPQALAAEENPLFDGYIIKVSEDAPKGLSLMSTDITDIGGGYFLADSLEEAESFADANHAEYIEPNYYLTLFDYTDDPYSSSQWNLSMIKAAAAWSEDLAGAGVKVAVVDSGLVVGHEDINYANIETGKNFTTTGTAIDTTDQTGHGSFVTGLIAAQKDNQAGIAGMTDEVTVLPLKCFTSKSATFSSIILAINEAIAQGCDVINMSFGAAVNLQALEDVVNAAAAEGIILIAAAGNDGTAELNYPAAYENVIGVGSVDSMGIVSDFSQRNNSVFVTAPGENLVSLWYEGTTSYYIDGAGTSFSTPCVTAIAAIVKQYDKDIDTAGFKTLLINSVTDKGVTGYDTSYGYGLVDVESLVANLKKSYVINYNLNGGSWSGDVIQQFQVTSETIQLPEPEKWSYLFAGWYEDSEFLGEEVTEIPAGSVGDRTFYAKWIDNTEMNTDITDVSVSGYAGITSGEDAFTVYIPAGATPTADSGDVLVTTENPNATYQAETLDSGVTWTITITAADETTTKNYVIYIDNTTYHAPAVVSEAGEQSGSAKPGSYDGNTAAQSYEAQVSLWFVDEDIADSLTYAVVSTTAQGEVTINSSNVLTYIPVAEDAGENIIILVKANDGRFDSISNVTITVAVDNLPDSNSVISPSTATFDKYVADSNYQDIRVTVTFYDNLLTAIKNGDADLSVDEDYTVTEETVIVGGVSLFETTVTIKKEYLAGLEIGRQDLTFVFSGGDTANLAITISDNTPIFVTNITSVPETATAGKSLTLSGTVVPADATYQTIVWSVKNAGTTGARISSNILSTSAAGTVIVTATIVGGALGGNYTQDFLITVSAAINNGGGGGGGGGGSYTEEPAEQYLELFGDTGTIQLPYTLEDDNVNLEIDDDTLSELLTTVLHTGRLSIDMSDVTGAEAVTISLDAFKAIVEAAEKSGDMTGISFKLPGAEITMDITAMKNLAEAAVGKNITISVKPVALSDLTAKQKASVKDAPVYDLTIESGNTLISQFGGDVTVSLAYTLKAGEESAGVVILRLGDTGSLTEIACTYQKTKGMVSFTVDHFSYYMIAYDALKAWENPFSDVKENAWYYDSVCFVNCHQLFQGTQASTFSPGLVMSRAMFVTTLSRLAGIDIDEAKYAAESTFDDVAAGLWYSAAVEWGVREGIFSGVASGQFGPDHKITREQIAVILYNYAQAAHYDVSQNGDLLQFDDNGKVSDWAKTAMRWAVGAGLIGGKTGSILDPAGTATRAEVAAIMQRFVENIVE